MTTISITQLYTLLAEKVGKETAENLTVYIEDKIKDEVATQSNVLATKQDLSNVELKLSERIADTRADMIKWMFIFLDRASSCYFWFYIAVFEKIKFSPFTLSTSLSINLIA